MWEQINQASHAAAARNTEDYCLAALLTWEKLQLAVSGILAIEAWRTNVYRKIRVRPNGGLWARTEAEGERCMVDGRQ